MLETDRRRLFLETLRPPAGMRLDFAVGTTYSLDLLALLSAPLAFTFFDQHQEDGQPLSDPLALLESLRRHAGKVRISCQAGRIRVPRPDQKLLAFLEEMVIVARALREAGVFHPKAWMLRYVGGDDAAHFRFICSTRNLTFYRCWDTALVLEGTPARGRQARSAPLADFLRALGGYAIRPLDSFDAAALEALAAQVERVAFEPPEVSRSCPDERWYWAAPLLLDAALEPQASAGWIGRPNLEALWRGGGQDDEEASGWSAHVEEAKATLRGERQLGRPPEDLLEVLAQIALAGPAVVALRALARVSGGSSVFADPAVRDAAGQVAFGFRSLFNRPETMALLRGGADEEERYWRRVLHHAAEGCLQSVLGEYALVLHDLLGLFGRPAGDTARELAEAIAAALALRTPTVRIDDIRVDCERRRIEIEPLGVRNHFALRFAAIKGETDQIAVREDQVRHAFNSPFWPFVLATTSMGQEGLDFHPYCHRLVHWNLPANPVDLEQREGRIHRYKGHAAEEPGRGPRQRRRPARRRRPLGRSLRSGPGRRCRHLRPRSLLALLPGCGAGRELGSPPAPQPRAGPLRPAQEVADGLQDGLRAAGAGGPDGVPSCGGGGGEATGGGGGGGGGSGA